MPIEVADLFGGQLYELLVDHLHLGIEIHQFMY